MPPQQPAQRSVTTQIGDKVTGIRNTVQKFFQNQVKKPEKPKTPIKGIGERIANAAKNNFRGIIGSLIPLCFLTWQLERFNNAKKVEVMWMWMIWFFLVQPVAIPCVGLIPVFFLPMSGTMPSIVTCKCYLNDNVVLYVITAMLIILLNNSGVDRRIAVWFICSGDACQYSGKRLVFKFSSAAFFLSMFSSRLIATSTLSQIITSALTKLDSTTAKDGENPNFITMRNVINNAIQTASGIGSTAIVHSSFVTLLFRGAFAELAPADKEYPDIFNYLQYSAFAFPVAFLMFIFNLCYHMMLINWTQDTPMTTTKMEELRTILLRNQAEIPRKVSLHERLSVIFLIILLCMFFFRWNQWIDGWSDFRRAENSPDIPKVKDATVAAIFLIVLHVVPKGYGFLKYLDAEKKSELPPLKPESAILWWRFVDRNVNYGYFYIFGSTFATIRASILTGLDKIIAENSGLGITGKPWNSGIFLCVFVTAILCNVTTAMAACAIWIPFVLCMSVDAPVPWPGKVYAAALGVGIASSFGFCLPFRYTPAYFCHHTGKVPIKKMIKYSFASVWICLLTLYVALLIWAPFLFDPEDYGIRPADAPDVTTTPSPPTGR